MKCSRNGVVRQIFCLALALALASVSLSTALTAQSFTANRIEAGRTQWQLGNYQEAIIELELAGIGLVDDPAGYAHCKTLLFLSQFGARQRAQAKATLLLIARIEEQFGAYTAAPIGAEVRSTFESVVAQQFADEPFTQAPGFGELIRQSAAAAQPEPQDVRLTTAELKRQAAANPNDPRLLEPLAERLYQEKKVADAQRAAEGLIALEPANVNGLCIQATTRAARNRSQCLRFLPQMDGCPQQLRTAFYTVTRLQCHLETETFNEGRDFLSTLPPSAVAVAKVNGLARKISKRADPIAEGETATPPTSADGVDAALTAVAATAHASEAGGEEPAPSPAAIATDPLLVEQLSQLVEEGNGAVGRGERDALALILERVQALADSDPGFLEAQSVAGQFAYLLSDWTATIKYLERAGGLSALAANDAFYLAVAYWETGEESQAQQALRNSLERGLVSSELVENYEKKILGLVP